VKAVLYTDASIKGGRGAWAALVLVPDADPIEYSGRLRGSFVSSAATEICAIANGLHSAGEAGLLAHGGEVEVWCDNEAAVFWANGQVQPKRKSDPVLVKARRFIRDYCKGRRITFRAYHVKGHQRLDSRDPGAIYNNRCDELCSAQRDNVEPPPFSHLVERVANAQRLRAAREARKVAEEEA